MNIPEDLFRPADLMGKRVQTYWHVVLPLAKPALAAVAVFQFVWTWTDFLLLSISTTRICTRFRSDCTVSSTNTECVGPLMAASVLFTTPALFVFLVAQKYFIQGISLTGLK